MAPSTQHILLAGATGYIGRAVAQQLLAAGYRVTALTRGQTTPPVEHCHWLRVDITDPNAVQKTLDGRQFDAVISCVASRSGISEEAWRVDHDANQTLLDAALASGATQFVLLSAICVQRPKLAFQHAKLAFEATLQQANIDHTIVRPTAFFKSLSGQIERVKGGKAFLLFGDGNLTACKPISNIDLARYIIECLQDPSRRNTILPIGGPGTAITPREQGELLFELTGKTPAFRSVSPRMLTAAAAILSPLGALIPAVAAKAELARIGHYYATESMLLWDAERQCYDAGATPAFGTMTLRAHYEAALLNDTTDHALGAQKLFRD